MDCDIFMLADSAQIAGDKFFILGGGWTELHLPSFPVTHPMAVAVGMLVEPSAVTRRHAFSLSLVEDSSGRRIVETDGEIEIDPVHGPQSNRHQRASLVLNLLPRFEAPGAYTLALDVDGRPVRRTSFSVRRPQPVPTLARHRSVAAE